MNLPVVLSRFITSPATGVYSFLEGIDMTARTHIGTQGWIYDGWLGSFYPPRTSKQEMLTLYSKVFDTVEIDSTFYAIPSENSVKGWARRTPPGFVFSVKLSSEITHKNRLRDSRDLLLQFTKRMELLEDKLGSILIQLPPDFSPTEQRALGEFLAILPSGFRFAVEFRDAGGVSESTLEQLQKHNVALTLIDSRWIHRSLSLRLVDQPTADFSYLRWLGPRELTDLSRVQIDRTKELNQWAEAFGVLKAKVPLVFGYFNNHFQGHSPASSNEFKRLVGLPVVGPDSLIVQPSLF
jgi:uncharacterized protein YecE (DUF72 family)